MQMSLLNGRGDLFTKASCSQKTLKAWYSCNKALADGDKQKPTSPELVPINEHVPEL